MRIVRVFLVFLIVFSVLLVGCKDRKTDDSSASGELPKPLTPTAPTDTQMLSQTDSKEASDSVDPSDPAVDSVPTDSSDPAVDSVPTDSSDPAEISSVDPTIPVQTETIIPETPPASASPVVSSELPEEPDEEPPVVSTEVIIGEASVELIGGD